MAGAGGTDRRRCAPRRRVGARARADRVRVRSDGIRRARRRRTRRTGSSARADQDRTFRRCMMRAENAASTVDGNAAAGMLWDVFGADVTALIGVCGGCGSHAPMAETVVELDEVAAIVRCRACTHTLFTVLRTG